MEMNLKFFYFHVRNSVFDTFIYKFKVKIITKITIDPTMHIRLCWSHLTHTTGKSKISVGGNETDKKIYFILSVRENRQENYKTDRKMVNVLSVYVTDRKIGNTLSVFLVHTGKIIYFLSGTDYFCRYFSNTQENYEKKSTRQNLPQSEHPAPSENPKNPVQRQKEKKRPTART